MNHKILPLLKSALLWLLLVSCIATCFSACNKGDIDEPDDVEPTDEELIEDRIDEFLTAYNDGDMEAVLECLEARTRNAFEAMLNLLGGLAGKYTGFDIDLSDLFSLGVSTTSGDFMDLYIISIVISDDTAVVTTSMEMCGEQMTIYFDMVYEKGGWYIQDMSDRNSGVEDTAVDPDNIDDTFLTNNEPSQGLEFSMNDSNGYSLMGMGTCTDSHIVVPERPVEYNEVPVVSVNFYSINAEYVTLPATVVSMTGVSETVKAINYLGTLDDWCNIDFYRNPCSNGALLYINGEPISDELVIPASIESVAPSAFQEYSHITNLTVSSEIIGEYAFADCKNLTKVTVSDGAKTISRFAFMNCKNLTEITVSDTVVYIGDESLNNCMGLSSINIGKSVNFFGENVITNTQYANDNSNYISGVLYIGQYLYKANPDVINVDVKAGTVAICDGAFRGCEYLQTVNIPDSVLKIGSNAFDSCSNLKSVTLGKSVESIGDEAFKWCGALERIDLPDTLKTIGRDAFYACEALKTLSLGSSLKEIKESVFGFCDSLRTVYAYASQLSGLFIGGYNGNLENCLWLDIETNMPIGDTVEYNGNKYTVISISGMHTWSEAKAFCESYGGHLATLTTAEENKAVFGFIKDLGHESVYFGLADNETEGEWKWVTGEGFDYRNWKQDVEPNGYVDENYACFYVDYTEGEWNDAGGDEYNSIVFICEWEKNN